MSTKVLFAGSPGSWPVYKNTLSESFDRTGLDVDLMAETSDPTAVEYIVYAPNGLVKDFTPFTKLKAVLSTWAGVESFQNNATLTAPLARMVDRGLSEGMREWVLAHTMRYHMGIDLHILGQDGIWRNDIVPPLARNRTVGILGLGELGLGAARVLQEVGFRVCGWSRRQKSEPRIECFSGSDGLVETLKQSEIVVLLLPLTSATENTLNAEMLAHLPKGAFILNPGRGPLIDDEALLAALDSGHVAHATLDVFRIEPLPVDHAYWAHPNVTVTPHIASDTRADTASDTIAENVRRGEAGLPFLHLVDRKEDY